MSPPSPGPASLRCTRRRRGVPSGLPAGLTIRRPRPRLLLLPPRAAGRRRRGDQSMTIPAPSTAADLGRRRPGDVERVSLVVFLWIRGPGLVFRPRCLLVSDPSSFPRPRYACARARSLQRRQRVQRVQPQRWPSHSCLPPPPFSGFWPPRPPPPSRPRRPYQARSCHRTWSRPD